MLFSKQNETWLIVGLGNPGSEYEKTRHNTGFLAMDLLAGKLGCKLNHTRFRAQAGTCAYHGKKLVLTKPQTFMNLSGMAVEPAAHFYKIPPDRIVVIFDDISLPVGRLRVRADGSAGGHNGIKSIIHELGTDQFPRVKVGVGAKPHPDYDLADWVLSTFSSGEEKSLLSALDRAADAALSIITSGIPETANRFNGKC